MDIYIDCEWNDFGGELISMALVPRDGPEFYEVLPCPCPQPWVEKNVIPILAKKPIDLIEFRVKLREYLKQFQSIRILADWPEDIIHFCNMLIVGAGQRMGPGEITFVFDHNLSSGESKVPHNALWDARAIRDSNS